MCSYTRFTMRLLGVLILGVCVLRGSSIAQNPVHGDAKAMEIAEKLLVSMGGMEKWEKARYFRFDFVVEKEGKMIADFKHLWDRYTGRYRVEGVTEKGEKYVILFKDINSKQGDAFVNGKPSQGDEKKKFMDTGYERFINDSYWILMPYKWKDPGVILKYEGTSKGAEGKVWDKVLLTFDNVGLTPKDKYWGYVNQATGLMDKWEFILNGGKGPATMAEWSNWQNFGGIMLSTEKKFKGQPLRILFKSVAVSASTDEKQFTVLEANL